MRIYGMEQIQFERSAMRFANSINILDSIKSIDPNDGYAHFLVFQTMYIQLIRMWFIMFLLCIFSLSFSPLVWCRCMVVCAASRVWCAKHRCWIQMRVSVSVAFPSPNARKCCQKPRAVTNHCQRVCSGCCAPVKCQPKTRSSNCPANGPIAPHCHNTLLPCWTICQTHCIQCRNFQQPSRHWTTTANLHRPTHKYVALTKSARIASRKKLTFFVISLDGSFE